MSATGCLVPTNNLKTQSAVKEVLLGKVHLERNLLQLQVTQCTKSIQHNTELTIALKTTSKKYNE